MPGALRKQPEYVVPMLIPDPVSESFAGTHDVFNPENPDESVWKHVSSTREQADAAIEEAAKALEIWSMKPGTERRDAFLKAAQLIEERGEELAAAMNIEMGQVDEWTTGFNVPVGAEFCREIGGRITTECTQATWNASSKDVGTIAWKEPIGVVFAIAPWNASLVLGLRSILYPLAAGCTVVFKASERCPRAHYLMCELLQKVLPRGALSMVTGAAGDPEQITKHIIHNRHVKKINFTGSTTVGRIIAKEAGIALKPVLLELGGKAAAFIAEDADLEKAAKLTLEGAFLNAGQICMSTERVIIVRKVYDEFIKQVKIAAKSVLPPGPLVAATAASNFDKLVETAVKSGAKKLDLPFDDVPQAHRQRVVLTDVTQEMDIFHQESFAPMMVITVVDSEEEGVRVVNDCLYGLSASIFTRDLHRALKLAREIHSGAVHINGNTVHDEPTLPHGGVNDSGYGRFGAGLGIQEFLITKVVTFQ